MEPEGSFGRTSHTQLPLQIFVQYMFRIDLLLSVKRANMCTAERENKENGGTHNAEQEI